MFSSKILLNFLGIHLKDAKKPFLNLCGKSKEHFKKNLVLCFNCEGAQTKRDANDSVYSFMMICNAVWL